ncbi:MAG: cation:proton antiporter [Microcoleus sp. PH2017_10_PVI_O_A]|uniref:cation:proton antiporter n=1 Tax=unclassified Microcoleus TaxID=2642155 RepID=UPI001E16E7D4|nr:MULTISPECIES: cation:proton antiporter [unclassified Microcoleus]TAE83108.1 MAG: cation:proton antiporter [Oscillatoriales cyanobacterium]MCC3406373.1 cation:proton antiporter [Microcoleus sp. PH2017_10_PVI_O_A]MCC3460358.1 cation:proton antiporter [Microcoleus sp. PH2017_11_PCY_U_A]MCC3478890.1 cation:proton antiporter [Microcoleus sp. PH2017_12_PCY_D_A]MCC3528502.1 cation:proton antiporter [Microcoleus sp. PH2017_21_RUC_O_A]
MFLNPTITAFSSGIASLIAPLPLLATLDPENSPIVLSGVLLSLVAIYLASKIGAEIARNFDFPPVLGELVAGVIVGVSALHLIVFPESGLSASNSGIMTVLQSINHLSPAALTSVFESQSEVVSVLAELGVIVLLFEIGLESDLKQLKEVGIQATVVACVGVAVPFAAGTAGLMIIFHTAAIPAIFAGAALTATSIGITSKVLSELGRLQSKEGQIIVGAAVIDDVLGIIVLAVVASLAKTGEIDVVNVIYLIVSATAFLLGSILLGGVFNKTFSALVHTLKTRGNMVIPAFTFAFFMAFLGNAIHLEAILGAFAAGLVLDDGDTRNELDELVKPIADLLVPIFFVTVGARADLGVLNPTVPDNRAGLLIAVFLIAVAIVGKLVTGWAVFGVPGINRWAIGVGMIPRGEVGLVFAGIGSASGVLDKPLEVSIIIMVILTTFLAPPFLRIAFGDTIEPPAIEKPSSEKLGL